MDLFFNIVKLFQETLISGMFISVLFIICLGYISKKINIKQPLNILRWIIITYATIGLLSIPIALTIYDGYLERATGPYWWSYLLMLISSSCFPFILLHKKISSKKFLLLIISTVINIGWLFERFVIIATSIHRDYAMENKITWFSLIPVTTILNGLSIGLLAFLTGNMISRNNKPFILSKKQKI